MKLNETTDNDNDNDDDPTAVWKRIQPTQVFLDPPRTTRQSQCASDCTRLVLMSDTHSKHREMAFLPPGDVLLHAGDFTCTGEPGTVHDLNDYFESSGFDQVICIAGNHDITLDASFYNNHWPKFHKRKFDCEQIQLQHCIYLQDSSCTLTKGGLTVYGSPWSPEFYTWAFGLPRGGPIQEVWSRIPACTDILMTHGPPLGRGDLTVTRVRAGCYDLLRQVQNRIRPRVHVFGHIHEGHGVSYDGTTLFINASNLDARHRSVCHPCIVVDVPHDTSQPAMVVEPQCQVQNSQFGDWLRDNGFLTVAAYADKVDLDKLPSGNALLRADFWELCDSLLLHRDAEARNQLSLALSQLYAQSFG